MSAELTGDLPVAALRLGLLAAILGGLAVALGAFGAHLLPSHLEAQGLPTEEVTRRLANWETAARYQMYHALALCAVAWLATRYSGSWLVIATGLLFFLGVLIFSGCLYALVLSGVKILGAIVPIGGLFLIAGWITLAGCFLQRK